MGWEKATALLDRFTRDERVLDPVQSILGPKVTFHQTKYNPKASGGVGEKWDPHRGIDFWHLLDGIPDPLGMVSVFIALTDQTLANGAVSTWLGAHRFTMSELLQELDRSDRKAGETDKDTAADLSLQIRPEMIQEHTRKFPQVYLTGLAGTVWILDSRNLHASQPNNSNRVRILAANVYRSVSNYPAHPRDKAYLCNTSRTPLQVYRGAIS